MTSGCRRAEWVYVDDVVEAFVAAAGADLAPGTVLEIGTGEPVTVREVVECLVCVVDGPGRAHFGAVPERPFDLTQTGDPEPAAQRLGWRAATPLREGLERTVEWYARTTPSPWLSGSRTTARPSAAAH